MTTEASIQRAFIRAVKKAGGWARKFKGPRGWKDYIVIWNGPIVDFVELKAPGKKPRKSQTRLYAKLAPYGVRPIIIDTLEKTAKYIEDRS